jgi:hypothetical protein
MTPTTISSHILSGIALAISIGAIAVFTHEVRDLHLRQNRTDGAVTHIEPGKFSRLSWPTLTQDQTIDLGERLKKLGDLGEVTIYCSSVNCQALRNDFDDAFQIADWKDEFEDRFVDSEADVGLFVGPPGKAATDLADAIEAATGTKPSIVPLEAPLGLIIGKRP